MNWTEEIISTRANIRKRILAGFVDYLIICTLHFTFLYTFGEPNDKGGYTMNGFLAFVPFLFWGFMTVGVELLYGATIGNRYAGLKPVSLYPPHREITFAQSLKRHSLDCIDMLFFGLIGIIIIKTTERNQRLGDIWAKTIVVHTDTKKTNGNKA